MFTHLLPGEIMGESKASMQWKFYWRNVISCYRVIIKNWPEEIPFKNLSEALSRLQDLEGLLQKWKPRTIFWRSLTNDEFNDMETAHNEKFKSGKVDEPHCHCHSDHGKKRGQPATCPGQASDKISGEDAEGGQVARI